RSAEAGEDFHYTDISLADRETHAPFLDGKLHPVIEATDTSIRVRLGTQCERRPDPLANRQPGVRLDPEGLLRGPGLELHFIIGDRIGCGFFQPAGPG